MCSRDDNEPNTGNINGGGCKHSRWVWITKLIMKVMDHSLNRSESQEPFESLESVLNPLPKWAYPLNFLFSAETLTKQDNLAPLHQQILVSCSALQLGRKLSSHRIQLTCAIWRKCTRGVWAIQHTRTIYILHPTVPLLDRLRIQPRSLAVSLPWGSGMWWQLLCIPVRGM